MKCDLYYKLLDIITYHPEVFGCCDAPNLCVEEGCKYVNPRIGCLSCNKWLQPISIKKRGQR